MDFDEMLRDLDREQLPGRPKHRARALWSRLQRVVRDHSPAVYWRRARWFVQRGRRGWSDSDTWGFDSYLCHVIAGGTRLPGRAGWHGKVTTEPAVIAFRPWHVVQEAGE